MSTPADRSLDIHLIAIGGTGMAPLACLLQAQGHRVQGSDGPVYPPMSTLLADAGITPLEGFDPRHLEPRPDLVIVGNAVPRDNPEAVETERLGVPRLSMPQALARFFLDDHRPLVIAGTHGKTTTTSLAAWVYSECRADPSYLVGGIPIDLEKSFHTGRGERFIIEGDEYNAAYFDRGPKFLHYRPHTLVLTSVEYDHADLYPDHESLIVAYEKLVELLPADGLLVACGDSQKVREVARRSPAPVVFYGLAADNHVHPEGEITADPSGCHFSIVDPAVGTETISIQLHGEHNVANALAVWTVAQRDGLPVAEIKRALASFRGVRRRLEEVGTASGVTVIDDFAHHPTAVAKTLAALRERFGDRRLVVVYEPRTLTAGRRRFFEAYIDAFSLADAAFFAPIYHSKRLDPEDRLDLEALERRLRERGVEARRVETHEDILESVASELRPEDVVITMSSGDFGHLPQRLLALLRV
ncbi:MAG: UDP-N-acetylmuramate--L-alanine ligase [Thermoanaerobaculia bacterium]